MALSFMESSGRMETGGDMNEETGPSEAAQALADIQRHQQQVIDLASIPAWYWWAVAVLMVGLAAGIMLGNRAGTAR
jgi:hypothetical protein